MIEAAAPDVMLVEVWRFALSLKKDLRMQIHIRKTRDDAKQTKISESAQIETAIKRANYLRNMFHPHIVKENKDSSTNWRYVLERLRREQSTRASSSPTGETTRTSKRNLRVSPSRTLKMRKILRAVKDFVIADSPSLCAVDNVRKIHLERCLRRRDALNLSLSALRIACSEKNEILASKAVSFLEPLLWQLQSALSTLKEEEDVVVEEKNDEEKISTTKELRLPGVLSGVRSVTSNIASDLVHIWSSVQKNVSSYLRKLPLPLPPPRTPMTPPKRQSPRAPSPVPLLLGSAATSSSFSNHTTSSSSSNTTARVATFNGESRTTTISFESRTTRGRVSPRTLWSPLLRAVTSSSTSSVSHNETSSSSSSSPIITEIENEEKPSVQTTLRSQSSSSTHQISSLHTQKSAVRIHAVALFGMLRLGSRPTEFVNESKLMLTLTSYLPRVGGNNRPWDTLTNLQRLTMTVMRSLLLQMSELSLSEDSEFNVPAEMAAIMFAELREMVKILRTERNGIPSDEDESVMIVSETRNSCFQLLRLLRSIRLDNAVHSMIVRNVHHLCDLFRHGDGRLQRRVSEMFLSIFDEQKVTAKALSMIFNMLWSCIKDHVSEDDEKKKKNDDDEKHVRRAIIRLDYRACFRLLSMARTTRKRMYRVNSPDKRRQQQQPPDVHVRVISASELQRLLSRFPSISDYVHYAGQWGILKRVRQRTKDAVVRFESEDGGKQDVTMPPEALVTVCDMKTVLKLECRESSRHLNETLSSSSSSTATWERIDHEGRWKPFANVDTDKLEIAWKQMKPIVRLNERHVVDLSRMIVSTISQVDSNEESTKEASDMTMKYTMESTRLQNDVFLGKFALSHNESVATFLSCMRIRRRSSHRGEDQECENEDSTLPTRVSRIVREIDEASRYSVRASEATRLLRLLLEREMSFDWSACFQEEKLLSKFILSHLQKIDVRIFVDKNTGLSDAIVASNILNGFVEPIRIGGSVIRRNVPLHRNDLGTLLHENDDESVQIIWRSSKPPRIERVQRSRLCGTSATDAPITIMQQAVCYILFMEAVRISFCSSVSSTCLPIYSILPLPTHSSFHLN